MMAILEADSYRETRQALAADPTVKAMAYGVRNEDIRELYTADGSPRGDFMVAALREYANRGGKIGGHIGGVAEAIWIVLAPSQCGRTLRKDGRPWVCALTFADHLDGSEHEAYDNDRGLVTTWAYGKLQADDQITGTTAPTGAAPAATQTSAGGATVPTPDGNGPELEATSTVPPWVAGDLHAACEACGFTFKHPQRRATCQSEAACARRQAAR